MMEEKIVLEFLDQASQKGLEEIRTEGKISHESAFALILKYQVNHVAHLEQNMVTKTEFSQFRSEVDKKFDAVDKRFEAVDKKLEKLENKIDSLGQKMLICFGAGCGFLSFVLAWLHYHK